MRPCLSFPSRFHATIRVPLVCRPRPTLLTAKQTRTRRSAPLPHLHRDCRAHPSDTCTTVTRPTAAHICTATWGHCCHIGTRSGLTPPTSAPGLGCARSVSLALEARLRMMRLVVVSGPTLQDSRDAMQARAPQQLYRAMPPLARAPPHHATDTWQLPRRRRVDAACACERRRARRRRGHRWPSGPAGGCYGTVGAVLLTIHSACVGVCDCATARECAHGVVADAHAIRRADVRRVRPRYR